MSRVAKTKTVEDKTSTWRTLEPAWFMTGIGVALQVTLWLIAHFSAESRDPNIGLGLLMFVGIGITLLGLLMFAVVLRRLKKLIPIAVAILYVLGLWVVWMVGEEHSNAIYRAEQSLRTTQHFEGQITAIDNACASDGLCTMTVAGREIITGCGLTFDASGCPPEDMTVDYLKGDQVKVVARPFGSGDLYTLNCTGCSISMN